MTKCLAPVWAPFYIVSVYRIPKYITLKKSED